APYRAAGPSTVSGLDGGFALSRVGTRYGGGLGTLSLLVCHDGYRLEWVDRPGAEAPLAVVLHPGGRVTGQILGPDGAPVTGAAVHLSSIGREVYLGGLLPPNPCPQSLPGEQAWTDATGHFALSRVAPGWYDLTAESPGLLGARLGHRIHVAADGEEVAGLVIRLEQGAAVAGRGSDSAGIPIASVTVDGTAVNDGDGGYRLEGLPPGRRQITARLGGAEYSRWFEVKPGENRLDLTLERDGGAQDELYEVHGRVLAPDGTAVAGARIAGKISAEDGSFTVRSQKGTYRFEAGREGFADGAATVTVAGSRVEGVEIRLQPACGVTGRLLGLEREELAAAHIVAEQDGRHPGRLGYVDPDGRFRLEDLAPGEWTLEADSGAHRASAKAILKPGVEAVLDLSFPDRFEVNGRVVGMSGEPVPNAEVYLDSTSGRLHDTASTGDDGTFALRAENGLYTVKVWASRYVQTSPVQVNVANAAARPVVIELQPGAVLSGRVLGIEPGDRVTIKATGSAWMPSEPDLPEGSEASVDARQDGTFVIRDLAPGHWQVTAATAEWTPLRAVTLPVDLLPGSKTSLDLDLGGLPHELPVTE
nr:carboxypeptidase regulatory-like domain-containing protein [Acidobacteriota bacterium]